jgi:hypothetical protein
VEDIVSRNWALEGRNTLEAVKFERVGNESKGLMIRSIRKNPVRWSFDNIFTLHLDRELANSEFYHK